MMKRFNTFIKCGKGSVILLFKVVVCLLCDLLSEAQYVSDKCAACMFNRIDKMIRHRIVFYNRYSSVDSVVLAACCTNVLLRKDQQIEELKYFLCGFEHSIFSGESKKTNKVFWLMPENVHLQRF